MLSHMVLSKVCRFAMTCLIVEEAKHNGAMAERVACLFPRTQLQFLLDLRAFLTLLLLALMASRCATSTCIANALNHALMDAITVLRQRP